MRGRSAYCSNMNMRIDNQFELCWKGLKVGEKAAKLIAATLLTAQ